MEWISLLRAQRDLLDLPRGQTRFSAYLKLVQVDGLPLAAFNPMSKPHVAALLDELLALDAEAIGAAAMREAAGRLVGLEGVRVGLVVADDAKGGWTNRWLYEAKDHFERKYELEHGLVPVLLWSSDPADGQDVRRRVLMGVWRHWWMFQHGLAKTLRERLAQEGQAAQFAGVVVDDVSAAEVAILTEHLDTEHYPAIIACLYGDAAAVECGYDPLGLSERAGLRFAALWKW